MVEVFFHFKLSNIVILNLELHMLQWRTCTRHGDELYCKEKNVHFCLIGISTTYLDGRTRAHIFLYFWFLRNSGRK
jgi:hypothetical protein